MSVDHSDEPAELAARWERARPVGHRWTRTVGLQMLVVDPVDHDRDLVAQRLKAEGISVSWCGSPIDALVAFGRSEPDVVLVAPALEDMDACTFVAALRRHDARLILLGLDTDSAPAAGGIFLAGATAAVGRPYDCDEIMARLAAHGSVLEDRAGLSLGDIELDAQAFEVRIAGEECRGIPLKEFELLQVLMLHANSVVPTDVIRDALWGDARNAPSSNAIAVHAGRLRARLEGHARVTRIRGRGYRLSRD